MSRRLVVCVPGFLTEKGRFRLADALEERCQDLPGTVVRTLMWPSGEFESFWRHMLIVAALPAILRVFVPRTIRHFGEKFERARVRADLSGRLLADALAKWSAGDVNHPIHVVSHSLGTIVVKSALAQLDESVCSRLRTITFAGSVLGSGARPALDGIRVHRPDFRIDNYWSPRDRVLQLVLPFTGNQRKVGGLCGFDREDCFVNHQVSVGHTQYHTLAERLLEGIVASEEVG